MKRFLKKIIPAQFISIIRKLKISNNIFQSRFSTSISDNLIYPNFCLKASTDLRIFSNFRRNDVYRQILEHVSYEIGIAYLDVINKSNSELLKNIELFKHNDLWGNPELFEYPKIGKISPSTLRYIKVFGDLISLFKQVDGFKICEIGVGYGGQCRIINSVASPSEYTLVDIKPALMLSQCYLDNYIVSSVLKYKTMNELEVQNYDMIISNYAFSELTRSIQEVYLKKVILNSKRGYITFNEITPEHFKSYTREELLNIIPNSRIIDEKPLTHEKNCIIIWGEKI
jgi:putative sugar O-methyltransferase